MKPSKYAKFFINHAKFLSTKKSYTDIVNNRKKYLSPSLTTFEAYDTPLVLTQGKMQYMWDSDNNRYIDLLGQNLTISVGHCHPEVVQAAVKQMQVLSHCTTMYYNEQPSSLAKEIVETLPPHPSGEDWVVHLVNDGSEAVDLAAQMIRVYTGRPEIISLHKSYHGLQGYAAGLTAIGKATQPSYSSMFSSITHLPPNNAQAIEDHVKYSTGNQLGGIMIEPLQGYGGIYPLADGYMKDAFEIVKRNGGVTVADEVQTGYGRCGETFWGFQMKNNDVIPDMITIAKGMGNGVGIIGAVVTRRSIAEAFSTKMFFNTYGSNPVACAAARAVLQVMKKDKLQENCLKQGNLFRARINKLCEEMPQVYKEIRGSGLFQGLEIYGETNEESGKNAYELHAMLLKHSVVVGRGSAAGNVFRIQPPMCIQDADVNVVVNALEEVGTEWLCTKNKKQLQNPRICQL
jgi:alanine-glyoxylate transaminase/(R)-3-amino-2-methylpropionate-pyruvate transaminase